MHVVGRRDQSRVFLGLGVGRLMKRQSNYMKEGLAGSAQPQALPLTNLSPFMASIARLTCPWLPRRRRRRSLQSADYLDIS